MADIGTYGKFSHRRADKGSKVQRILNLFEISRPKKGLQRTNSLPNGKRPSSLSSNDLDIEDWCARSSMRHKDRKTPKNKEETKENHRSHHRHQILEEPDDLQMEEWESEIQSRREIIQWASSFCSKSDNFCDSDRLSMETLFHGIGMPKKQQTSDGSYWDFMRSRSHEDRLQSPIGSDGMYTIT